MSELVFTLSFGAIAAVATFVLIFMVRKRTASRRGEKRTKGVDDVE